MEDFKITQTSELPHQQRVITEANELGIKIEALSSFIMVNPIFSRLDKDEQYRLRKQLMHMGDYFDILADRINHF